MAPLRAIPPDLLTLADYEARAATHLPAASWRHIQEGAGAERTLRDNRTAFDRWRLLPRALADLRDGDTVVELFGQRHIAPILLAPLAYQRIAHPDGERATACASAALGTGMVVSTLSSVTLEDILAAQRSAAQELGSGDAPAWFQLYLQPERAANLALVRRAEAAGYQAIVLTIDAAIKRSSFALPDGVAAANLAGMAPPRQVSMAGGPILFGTPLADAAPRWDDLDWLRQATRLPIILKGMVLGKDLDRALSLGIDGLILSNHGGRVLDGLPSALTMLPGVVDRVAGRIPVLLDGGVRTGTDIVTAIALGARAVLIGRPLFHALAVAGMIGVAHMIHILRTELEMTMAQLGAPRLSSLKREMLVGPAPPRLDVLDGGNPWVTTAH
ncbi:alpha-hydroxy acid oxidase [Sphingomonas abietis]|uniref:Alpha-hydroxy acid oxidase n=1 Tax=Sphingomonas abietis TaxID=3012344 RepID=A0ABY7NHL1_9SPHN|nr:alpha-hydroxy acid oxidase [Sphingomonas abietis]WBO20974.1 alpha-hydroxy acid oxidase [Sphingomonas abietis]